MRPNNTSTCHSPQLTNNQAAPATPTHAAAATLCPLRRRQCGELRTGAEADLESSDKGCSHEVKGEKTTKAFCIRIADSMVARVIPASVSNEQVLDSSQAQAVLAAKDAASLVRSMPLLPCSVLPLFLAFFPFFLFFFVFFFYLGSSSGSFFCRRKRREFRAYKSGVCRD